MSPYIHHVPGRLRIRSPRLKCRGWRAERVRAQLEATPGVRSVALNPGAASVVIHYAPGEIGPEELLARLQQAGCLETEASTASHPVGASMAGAVLGKALFGAFVQSALERSVLSLVSAFK